MIRDETHFNIETSTIGEGVFCKNGTLNETIHFVNYPLPLPPLKAMDGCDGGVVGKNL